MIAGCPQVNRAPGYHSVESGVKRLRSSFFIQSFGNRLDLGNADTTDTP